MAIVKFKGDSVEFKMFSEYWIICQKYWEVEDTDEYWESLIKEAEQFFKKYKDVKLSKALIMGFLDTQEKIYKELKSKE